MTPKPQQVRDKESCVFIGCRMLIGRAVAAFAMALALYSAVPVQPASAQGLLDALFGNYIIGISVARRCRPRVSAYADPFGFGDERPHRRVSNYGGSSDHSSGPSSGYCVRTCDGKYFPVKSSGNMTATELCKSFCPAANTKVFSGSKIDYSVAPDGTRYADLDNAFLFRERTVDNCTCNGKTAGGLAPLKPELDQTLRPGDIVATNDGLATFNGNRNAKSAEFTPIDKSGGSSEWKLRLMSIKVTPAPARAEEPVKPAEEERKPRGPTAGVLKDNCDRPRRQATARGQPRRFNPEQMDEARQPVLRRAFDHEIRRRLARPGELRPDAGVVRLQ